MILFNFRCTTFQRVHTTFKQHCSTSAQTSVLTLLVYIGNLLKREAFLMTIYDYTVKTMQGDNKSLADYQGQVVLIVNTASKCGFTPQFSGLQELYEQYKEQDFVVLGFPCNQFNKQDPGSNEEIAEFCQLNYGVSFPMFAKLEVKGENKHPLFTYLTKETKGLLSSEIKWNFTKFLIDRNGHVIERFAPQTKPNTLTKAIMKVL